MNSMQVNSAVHLSKDLKVKMGSYYTPQELVDRVLEFVQPYLANKGESPIVFDSAGGCGAFLFGLKGHDYRIADRDAKACRFLTQHFPMQKVFCTNSLMDVSRSKFSIPDSAFLVMIGNPPYNDTTSEYRSGRKGGNTCDKDLYDRDLGISFLKSYNKLRADVICILHPLSYLIKEANFKRLREFKANYRLVKGMLFSSALFQGTGLRKFPIMVALYERNRAGMTYDYIRQFEFSVLNRSRMLILSEYQTTDGYVEKYPPRRGQRQISPVGLYYHTFRDLNSLKRNATFLLNKHYNGIVVTPDNFFKYAYLYSLRDLFDPPDVWLYGNLSPLVDIESLERNRELYVYYALRTNRALQRLENSVRENIKEYYGIQIKHALDIDKVKQTIKHELNKLV